MDPVSLRLEMDKAKYLKTRFISIAGQIFKTDQEGGKLIAKVNVGFRNAEGSDLKAGEHRFISNVKLQVFGVPASVSDDNETAENAIFKVEVEVASLMLWTAKPSKEFLDGSAEGAAHIARPLFMVAVTEAKSIASKLGFNGLELDVDIHEVMMTGPVNVVRGDAQLGSAKPASKSQARKRRSSP